MRHTHDLLDDSRTKTLERLSPCRNVWCGLFGLSSMVDVLRCIDSVSYTHLTLPTIYSV